MKLATAVSNSITDPMEIRKMQIEKAKLQTELDRVPRENIRLHTWVGKKHEELTTAQEKIVETTCGLERIRATFDISGDVYNKARLYDKGSGSISGAEVIKILVDFARKVEGCLADIRNMVKGLPGSSRQDPEEARKATGTPGSGKRRLTRLSASSDDDPFPGVPPNKTWEYVLKTVRGPQASVEIETPPSQKKEPEPTRIPESGPRVRLFSEPRTIPEPIEVVDLEEDEVRDDPNPEASVPPGTSSQPETSVPTDGSVPPEESLPGEESVPGEGSAPATEETDAMLLSGVDLLPPNPGKRQAETEVDDEEEEETEDEEEERRTPKAPASIPTSATARRRLSAVERYRSERKRQSIRDKLVRKLQVWVTPGRAPLLGRRAGSR